MANDINLPNLVSHLEVNLADTSGIVADATRQGSSVGAALGQSMRQQVARAVDEIPEVQLDANSSDLDRDLDRVRHDLQELADTRIGVDITVEDALRRMAELEPHLERLEHAHPSINVQAAVSGARAGLEEIRLAAAHLDVPVEIGVHVDSDRPLADLSALRRAADSITDALASIGPALGSLARIGALAGAAIPAVAGLVAVLGQIAPAAAVGVTAALAVGSAVGAVKLGTAGVGDALTAAFAPVTGGSGGGGGAAGAAAAATNAVAEAQRNLRDVTEQAAISNAEAARRVQDAERDLADAQQASLDAQEALNRARVDAQRQLEDLNAQLADARLDERQAVLDVQDAEQNLAAVRAKGSKATQEEQDRAQLQYDRAVQRLKEQQTETQRLQTDTDAANKAGVSGSQLVADAQDRVSAAARDVSDRQRDVADAQAEVTRTAAQGAEAIDRAREALEQAGQAAAGGSGGGAAGGIDKFAQAMAKLSPEAQAVVREIIALQPAFDDLRLDVQERLFAGLAAELDTTAHALLPSLRKGLDDSADSLNAMAKGAADAARDIADDGTLGRALDGANRGLSNLVPIPGQIVTAIGHLGAAAAPAFDRLTKEAADVITRLSDRLSDALASGELEESVDLAVGLLGELLDLGGNVIGVLTNVFAPAVADGTNFIGVLADITDLLVQATDAQDFQDALSALFGVIGEIGKVAGPLLLQALAALEPVFVRLGPPAEHLVDALGDALSPILDALAPLLVTAADGVGGLVEAALPLLRVAGQLVAALGPVLQPVLDAVVDVIGDLEPVVEDAADALSLALSPVLAVLPDLITPIVDLLATRLSVQLELLGRILSDNAPLFAELGLDLANLLVAITPLIELVAQLATGGLLLLTPALLAVIDGVSFLADLLADELSTIINGLVIPTITILADLLRFRFGAAWDEARSHAREAITAIVLILGGLPAAATRAIAPLARELGAKAADAGRRLVAPIQDGIEDALRWIRGLPGRSREALGDLGDVLKGAGAQLIDGLIDGITSKLDDVKGILGDLGGGISDLVTFDASVTAPVGSLVGSVAGSVPSASALAASYAGSAAPAQGPTTINLYGTEATPEGVSAALSWRSKVGRR